MQTLSFTVELLFLPAELINHCRADSHSVCVANGWTMGFPLNVSTINNQIILAPDQQRTITKTLEGGCASLALQFKPLCVFKPFDAVLIHMGGWSPVKSVAAKFKQSANPQKVVFAGGFQ